MCWNIEYCCPRGYRGIQAGSMPNWESKSESHCPDKRFLHVCQGVPAVRMYFQEPQFGVLPACTPLVHIARCDFIDLGQWLWSDFQEPQFGMLSYLPVPHCIPRRKRFHWYQTVALAGLPRATIQHATCLYLATVSDHETVSAWVGIQAGKPSMPN